MLWPRSGFLCSNCKCIFQYALCILSNSNTALSKFFILHMAVIILYTVLTILLQTDWGFLLLNQASSILCLLYSLQNALLYCFQGDMLTFANKNGSIIFNGNVAVRISSEYFLHDDIRFCS